MDSTEPFSMSESLSLIDLLQPWPHGLHVYPDGAKHFSACDCGWVGTPLLTQWAATMEYRDHIERPE